MLNYFHISMMLRFILVTRDPRGIYNSMKTRHSRAYPGDDLKIGQNGIKH